MASKGEGYGTRSKKGAPAGMFGFTTSQMRAQIANLGAKPTGAVQRVQADQAYAISKFGSSQTGSIQKMFVGARANAVMAAVLADVGKDVLKQGGRTIEDVAIIMKQGRAQQANAYAFAEAQQFQQQTNASDAQAAEVARAAWEHKMAMEEWKFQQDYTAKLMTDQQNAQGRTAALGIAQDMPLVSSVVKATIEDNRPEVGGVVDWATVSTDLAAKGLDENQLAVAGTMVQSLQYGTSNTMEEAINLASDKLFSQYPGYESWGGQVVKTSVAGYTSAVKGIEYHKVVESGGESSAPIQGQPGVTAAQMGLTPVVSPGQRVADYYEDKDGNRYEFNRQSMSYVPVSS